MKNVNFVRKMHMKTIKEAARRYSHNLIPDESGMSFPLEREAIQDAIKFGVQFAESWIYCTEELPICFESGDWDGLRSDFVIVMHEGGDWSKARLYSGIMDGRRFNDWYRENDRQLANVVKWRPLNRM